jgi:hypothetical protein
MRGLSCKLAIVTTDPGSGLSHLGQTGRDRGSHDEHPLSSMSEGERGYDGEGSQYTSGKPKMPLEIQAK